MADFSSLLGAAGIGGAIGKAIVSLELDTAKYQAELKAAQAQTATGTQAMSSGFAGLGSVAKAGLAAGAVAVVAFGANAIRAASDLGEAVNKSNVIFGDNARRIEEWAEGGATAFGLSKTAALDAAGGFGQMLQSAGLAVKESANMSMSITQLAGDIASFNNIDPTEALEKLRSGLAGEAEPLRKFGVFLSEAAVQQEAYQSGIAEVGAELTEAQKVQARYNIIFQDTIKAQGDFQRTADSLPNQIRSMRAEFENVSAEVGEALLPVVTDLLSAFRTLIPLIGVVADNFEILVIAGVGFAAWKFIPPLLILIRHELDLLNVSALGAATSLGTVAKIAPLAGLGIGGYQDAVGKGIPIVDEFVEKTGYGTEAVKEQTEAVGEAGKGLGNFRGIVADTTKDVTVFANKTEEEFKDWATETKAAIKSSIFQLQDFTTESEVTQEDVRVAFREMRQDAREFARAMEDLPKGKWVNEEFLTFISDQGPDWLIQFAGLNKEQQKKMQEDWEESGRTYNRAIKGSFLNLNDTLDTLDNKTTKHTVEVHYKYVDFDPSKPGMQPSGQRGGQV